jgi:hypothetical protein
VRSNFIARSHRAFHSVAWHLWHASRWDDVLAAIFCQKSPTLAERVGTTEQLWHRESVAAAWGLPIGELGLRDAGTGLADDVADSLVLPDRRVVRAYAEGAFAFAASVLGSIDDHLYLQPAPGDPDGDTYGANILIYAGHDDRHLGMIEAIRGVLGLRGTATT